ncbi:MAG: ABC transporter ATP-binding protein [Woeseiaceae bacterium]
MASIRLDNVSFRYPGSDTHTLDELRLDIADGEAHALLGASGAGKTTLLNLLSGLLSPTSGRISFDDDDVSDLVGSARNVAQVFQFPVLYESLSVLENLAFPLRAKRATAATIAERVEYVSAELGIAALHGRKPGTLTLSEKQLVAVGKALVRPDTSLVLLDEPLTAVEPRKKWRLRQALLKAQVDLGVTMIYVTHDQTEALTFAERVSVLTVDGILQTGTPKEIYQSPAHEFVGHFVGSPGMNFVPAAALNITDGDRIGFRPEWAVIDTAGPIEGTVKRIRIQSTVNGVPVGLITLDTELGELAVRGEAHVEVGTNAALRVNRYVAFANKTRVGEGAIA